MSVHLYRIIGSLLNLGYFINPQFAAAKAIRLFSTPRRKYITPERRDFLDSALREELRFGDAHIMTYRWLGKKDNILLVHGWESESSRWISIARQLKGDGYGLIALDAPAHGGSGYKTFDAFLYSEFINVVCQKFKPTIVIAHSVGGFATMLADASHRLKDIKKMILLGSPREFSSIYKRYITMMGYHKFLVKKISQNIHGMFGQLPEDITIVTHLKKVTSRLLVIHDKEDQVIPYYEGIIENIELTNADIYTTSGLGHSLEADLVYEKITSFISLP